MSIKLENINAKTITPANGRNPRQLYEHQEEALKKLDAIDKGGELIFQQNLEVNKMSMSVYRFNKDKSAKDATVTFYYPLAAQKIWDSIWRPAILEMKCCLITDFGSFLPQQLENAIMELNNILDWSKKHCEIKEQDYMQNKIDNLKIRLETEAPNSNEPFYIF